MTSIKVRLLAGSLLSGVIAAAVAPAAQAQTTSPGTSTVEELVVTGSRIHTNQFTSPAPLAVITSEEATLQGLADTSQILQVQPIASGSFQTNGQLSAFVTTGGPGVSTISLRGLGATRTLVLLDGRRIGPAGVRGTVGPVDLNVIPAAVVDRTEILKDGASSIYGSDAVAGVVNFITKKNLDGGLMSVYGAVPLAAGGRQYEASVSWGKTYDRGYLDVAFDYTQQQELKASQRRYTRCAQDIVTDPASGRRLDFIDPATGNYKCFNVLTNVAQVTGFGGSFQRLPPGVTAPTAAQGNNIATLFPTLAAQGFVRTGRATFPLTYPYRNNDDPLYGRQSALSPYTRYTVYGSGGYDLTSNTQIYGDLLLNRRDSTQHGYQQLFPTIAGTNPNNIFFDTAGNPLDSNPVIAFKNDQSQRVDYARVVGGIKGKFGDLPVIGGWDWDIYGQYSRSSADYSTDFIYNDRLNAVTGPDVACDPTQITVSPATACISIPFYSQRVLSGNFNPQEAAFLFGVAHGNTKYTQAAAEGTITGTLLQLPAGPLGVALGFDLRRDEIDDSPDAQEVASNLYNLTAATPTRGSDTVKEVFGELSVPVLKDSFVGDFNLSLSGRRTNYRSYGSNNTYKVGGDWQIVPAFRLRATYGTSYRAPALYELYIGNQTAFQDQINVDPCIRYEDSSSARLQANCKADGVPVGYTGNGSGLTIITGGGAGVLKAETSKALTVGAIWTPKFDRFDLSIGLDYFDIKVANEVRQFGAGNIVRQCYLSANFPNDPLCKLFNRDFSDPANPRIDTVRDSYVNVAAEDNEGLDLNIRYAQQMFDWGRLTLDGQVTWQFKDVTQLLGESIPEDFNGTTVEPAFTGQFQAKFDRGQWTGTWSTDIYGKASDTGLDIFNNTDLVPSTRYNQTVKSKQYTEFTAYHNVSLRYKFPNWTVVGGVRNLFDEHPPFLSGINETFRIGNSALNAYDLLGRRVFFQIDRKF